jgi:hypothetical protein
VHRRWPEEAWTAVAHNRWRGGWSAGGGGARSKEPMIGVRWRSPSGTRVKCQRYLIEGAWLGWRQHTSREAVMWDMGGDGGVSVE